MIIKMLCNVFFICFISCFFVSKDDDSIKDIYGRVFLCDLTEKSCIYVDDNVDKVRVNLCGLEYEGGIRRLHEYLDSAYYNSSNFNQDEYNITEMFFLYFDEFLNIREVRIMKRSYANNDRYYYDSVLINALKNTQGQWTTAVSNGDGHMYICKCRVK